MEREITIRLPAPPDLDAILGVQASCPEAVRWSQEAIRAWIASAGLRSPQTGVIFLVAEETVEVRLVGFLLARTVAEEGEILNLAVRPDSRCRGIGRRLLAAGLERAAESGARRCWLEVRASNSTALLFYRRLGFAEQYRRPGYYREPDEAAVVCASSLPARRAAS